MVHLLSKLTYDFLKDRSVLTAPVLVSTEHHSFYTLYLIPDGNYSPPILKFGRGPCRPVISQHTTGYVRVI